MSIRLFIAINVVVILSLVQIYGDGTTKTIDREALSSRTYNTWLGVYAFSEENVLSIEGLKNLHILVYRCSGKEGTPIDFVDVSTNGKLRLLRETDLNAKDVTSTLEGVDVLVGLNEAEIIVRWRHPGQGGLRSVEKYCYSASGLELINRSEFVSQGRTMKWVSAETSKCSTPARYFPLRRVQPPASGVTP